MLEVEAAATAAPAPATVDAMVVEGRRGSCQGVHLIWKRRRQGKHQ